MEKTIKKKTVVMSLGITMLILFVSFSSVVGYQAVHSSSDDSNSPLFHLRLEKVTNQQSRSSLSALYIGKDKEIEIPLPTREILTEEILDQLSTQEVKEKISALDSDLVETWDALLTIARSNLEQINSAIRQDFMEYQALVDGFYGMSAQQAQEQFLEQMRGIDVHMLKEARKSQVSSEPLGNLTTGPLCNITSGWFCQITSQPICHITTQPICLITKGFFCWTLIGPICPTTGIKCHTPTARPILCSLFASAGKILKAFIIVVLLAAIIFIPLAILSLVFITVFNPERCNQIHERITTWFNCTALEE
jgi:hypothetical protein